MSILLRCCILAWAWLLGSPAALAQNGLPAEWAYRCETKDPPPYFDEEKPQYLWTYLDLPESRSTPGNLVINVYFLDEPTAQERKAVEAAARLWSKAAPSVSFDFAKPREESHVRIGLAPDRLYSDIGNRALRTGLNRPTMLLPRGDKHLEWKALHAFGHVLGLGHEFPTSGDFVWQVSNIFEDYWRKNWCDKSGGVDEAIKRCMKQIEQEVTVKGVGNDGGPARKPRYACPGRKKPDAESVMISPLGLDWLAKRRSFEASLKLSEQDEACVRQLYAGGRTQEPPGRPGGRAPGTYNVSVLPHHFLWLYRLCRDDKISTCEPIEVRRNDGAQLVFESGRAWRREKWVWEPGAAECAQQESYKLRNVSRVLSGRSRTPQGCLRRAIGYYDGEVGKQPGCKGEVYIRIGESCPEGLHVETGAH